MLLKRIYLNQKMYLASVALLSVLVVVLLVLTSVPIKTAQAKPAQAQTTKAQSLTINISGIKGTQVKNGAGNIMIVIYDNEHAFNNNSMNIHSMVSVKATSPTMNVSLGKFPQGRYAVSVLHDKNSNGQMDFAKNQLPREAYAFSKNVGTMSMPKFTDAEFTHRTNSVLNIKMIQPY